MPPDIKPSSSSNSLLSMNETNGNSSTQNDSNQLQVTYLYRLSNVKELFFSTKILNSISVHYSHPVLTIPLLHPLISNGLLPPIPSLSSILLSKSLLPTQRMHLINVRSLALIFLSFSRRKFPLNPYPLRINHHSRSLGHKTEKFYISLSDSLNINDIS